MLIRHLVETLMGPDAVRKARGAKAGSLRNKRKNLLLRLTKAHRKEAEKMTRHEGDHVRAGDKAEKIASRIGAKPVNPRNWHGVGVPPHNQLGWRGRSSDDIDYYGGYAFALSDRGAVKRKMKKLGF